MVKGVKTTPIFANITHQSKNKKVDLVETKMSFFFFLSNTYNFSSSASFTERLLIYSKKFLSSSSSTSLSSFSAQNGKVISFSTSFTERVLIFHHHLLFHYLPLMHKTKNLIFPSKTLENFSSIISSSVSFRILEKIVILFFSSYLILYLQARRKQ